MSEVKTRGDKAKEYFLEGYNCTQAVVLAFEDLIEGVDKDTLMKLSCSFGGGMGRLREVCGAVSGMFIVLGLLEGYSGPEKGEVKANHYTKVQELAKRFEAEHGSIVCREILGLGIKHDTPVPEARTAEYYKKRPCPETVKSAANILEKFLTESIT